MRIEKRKLKALRSREQRTREKDRDAKGSELVKWLDRNSQQTTIQKATGYIRDDKH